MLTLCSGHTLLASRYAHAMLALCSLASRYAPAKLYMLVAALSAADPDS